jgi:hypothetical protein
MAVGCNRNLYANSAETPALKLSGFCDGNPFAGKTIHRRADNVMQVACENRATGDDIFFTSVSIFFNAVRVYLR